MSNTQKGIKDIGRQAHWVSSVKRLIILILICTLYNLGFDYITGRLGAVTWAWQGGMMVAAFAWFFWFDLPSHGL